jgi:ATP-dependent RNA helicase RhlE
VPIQAEDYIHRIGRTGRAGREGTAIMICNNRDRKNFSNVESLLQKEIPRSNSYEGPSSVDQTVKETENLKTKKTGSDEVSHQNRKNKTKNVKNSQKSENSNSILGLGEHTPDFLSQSFHDRLVS